MGQKMVRYKDLAKSKDSVERFFRLPRETINKICEDQVRKIEAAIDEFDRKNRPRDPLALYRLIV